jgi:hypothetical protein
MRQRASIVVLSILSGLVSLPGAAQTSSDYKCVIERIETANNDADAKALYQSYIGKEFTVERKTGIMAGALKNNYVTEPVVVDFGSKENSFKVVTTMRRDQGVGAGSNAYILTVNEYVESERKPFLFAHNDAAYFGYCTHF